MWTFRILCGLAALSTPVLATQPTLGQLADAVTADELAAASADLAASGAPSLDAVLAENPNLYVYVVQEHLRSEGLRDTPANGVLNGATLRQMMQYCDDEGIGDICRRGPLLPETAVTLGARMAATMRGQPEAEAEVEAETEPAPLPPPAGADADAPPPATTPDADETVAAFAPADASWLDGAAIGPLRDGGALPAGWRSVELAGVEVLAIETDAERPYLDLRLVFDNTRDVRTYPRLEATPVAAEPRSRWTASATYQLLEGDLAGEPAAFLNVEARSPDITPPFRTYFTANRPADLAEPATATLAFAVPAIEDVELTLRVLMLNLDPGQSGEADIRIFDPALQSDTP